MAVGDDDMMEGSVSSLILDSLESNQSGDVLSPEDVAWVDSCLVKDSEISDSDWNTLKDALLDIISSQPDSLHSSAAGGGDFSKNDTEILPYSVEEAETAQFLGGTGTDLVPIYYEEMERSDDDAPMNKKTGTLLSQTFFKNAFLPNYNDDLKVSGNNDCGLDLGLPAYELPYSVEEAETAQFPGGTGIDLVPVYYEELERSDDAPMNKKIGTLQSQTFFKNAFLPNYNEDLKVSGNIDWGLDLGLAAYEMEPSTQDIFRVWDLDISGEEDELVEQLNKALEGHYFQSIPSTFDDSGAWKDMKELSVDDLVAGIVDLSLSRNSG